MRHVNEKRRKVRRFPSTLIATLKDGVLLNLLAFRDQEDVLIVPGWSFNLSQDELNSPEEASDKDYFISYG